MAWASGDKIKLLSFNHYTISDTFSFAEEIREIPVDKNDILVSCDVTSLFTNVPLDDSLEILAEEAFTSNWFSKTYCLAISKSDVIELLKEATKYQLFQFDGKLYERVDGVSMG